MNSNNKNVSKSSLQNTCKQDKSVDITTQKSKRKTPTIWRGIEQETFKNGLELYGRDWNKISQMDGIINKSIHSIKAYAMRYFALLWRDNIPLPSKVKETGNGYTLNGSPLDPNSPIVHKPLKPLMTKNNRGRSTSSNKPIDKIKRRRKKKLERKSNPITIQRTDTLNKLKTNIKISRSRNISNYNNQLRQPIMNTSMNMSDYHIVDDDNNYCYNDTILY
eukprot:135700_1